MSKILSYRAGGTEPEPTEPRGRKRTRSSREWDQEPARRRTTTDGGRAFSQANMAAAGQHHEAATFGRPVASGVSPAEVDRIVKAVEGRLLFNEESGQDLPFRLSTHDTGAATQGGWFDPHQAMVQRLGSNFWAPQGIRAQQPAQGGRPQSLFGGLDE